MKNSAQHKLESRIQRVSGGEVSSLHLAKRRSARRSVSRRCRVTFGKGAQYKCVIVDQSQHGLRIVYCGRETFCGHCEIDRGIFSKQLLGRVVWQSGYEIGVELV